MNDQYCNAFEEQSTDIYNWLKGQPSVGEESITDRLLFALSSKLPNIKYKKFTRHQEGRKTGADWEWWIVDNNAAISMRVQAKKLDLEDNYKGLTYSNKHGLQIEKLLDNAQNKNCIPIYAFYFASRDIHKVACKRKLLTVNHGVFLVSAQSLYDKYVINKNRINTKISASDIISISRPIHCLICCSEGGNSVSEIYNAYGISSCNFFKGNINQLGFHKEPANYVKSLLKVNSPEIPESWEQEYQQHLQTQNIRRLVVHNLT